MRIKFGFGQLMVTLCGWFLVALTLSIAIYLCIKGTGSFFIYDHSILSFLFSSVWSPVDDFAGGGQIGAAIYIFGSLSTCFLAICFALPFALASAIFISELSPFFGAKFFRSSIEVFVGIPSVVYGWVGLTVLVPFIAKVFSLPYGFSVLTAGIVLAVMIYPTITGITADALKAVPASYRQASYAMGATRWQMIHQVVLPSAKSGIYTAVILGLARAFGEALAVAMVIGKMRSFPDGLLSPTINLTAAIASDMGGAAEGGEYNLALWSMALLLFVISLVFIILVRFISYREMKKHL